jgi:general secretion pathway protein A
MYEHYYGLHERPFDLSPNPRFLFLSKQHGEALAHLRYGLSGRPGVTVLIGEAGTGKTTLIRAALQPADGRSSQQRVVHLSNPTLTRAEFYEYLAAGFGFSSNAGQSKTRFLAELETALEVPADGLIPIALVVDEAQSVSHELLEEIRLLTNLQSSVGQALTVVLAGQLELSVRLNEDRLRQLKQRISLRCELRPLDLQGTAAYIAKRVTVARGRPELLFTRDAVLAIHQYSQGIPRTVSVICENALISGFAADVKPVGRDVVLEVCRDFEIVGSASASEDVRMTMRRPAVIQPETKHASSAFHSGSAADSRAPEAKPVKPLFSTFTRARRFFFF